MKKTFLTLSITLLLHAAYAQTNTFPSTGNVGIGTTSPADKLDVIGNADFYNTGTSTTLNIGSGAIGKTELSLYTSADGSGYAVIQSVSAQGSAWGNTVISPNGGNVLIGKTSQTNTAYILDVNGSVRANGVVVNTSGADFVFKPSYRLSSLSSLKNYIDHNHHLPEIPSAKQMQANGLNLGDNQIKQLQKVEELTLYLIEKDEQIKGEQQKEKEMDEKLNKQQIQLLALQAQIDKLNKAFQEKLK